MPRARRQLDKAREVLSDECLLALIRALDGRKKKKSTAFAGGVIATDIVNSRLDQGERLDEIFDRTGSHHDKPGCHLSVRALGAEEYEISISCVADVKAGDGGTWRVSFEGISVASAELTSQCIS